MKVVVHRRAARYLQRLPADQKERLKSRLSELAQDPADRPDVREMKGSWEGYHRLRVGSRRVIFFIDHGEEVVYIDHIGPRGDIYKRRPLQQ